MELWIRSQDRLYLNIVSNISVIDNRVEMLANQGRMALGTYKTKERALEVLDEIQEVLCPKILMMKPNSQITLNDGVNIVLPDNCSYERIGDIYVYEMPKE